MKSKHLFLAATLFSATLLPSCQLLGLVVGIARSVLSLGGIKAAFKCIPEGTLIDTPDGARRIESIRPGQTVVGFEGEPVKVLQVHAYAEDATAEAFLKITFEDGARVDLCDNHRLAGRPAGDLQIGDEVAGRRIESIVRHKGVSRSYDLLTEDKGYRIGGAPVNSMIEEMYRAGREGRMPERHYKR